MQTQTAVSAANALIQNVESALPKQKKTQSVTEFKQAMVAHKRGSKALQMNKLNGSEIMILEKKSARKTREVPVIIYLSDTTYT
nr:F-box protein At5g52880 [Tanacetum cinerariifolium]